MWWGTYLIEEAELTWPKHNLHIGDESMIKNLHRMGRLGEKVPGGPDLTDADLKIARAAEGSSDPTAAKM
jgi:hypothetical protein